MSIHNFKFIRVLLTASIVLVFLTDESFGRNIRFRRQDQPNLQHKLHSTNLSLRKPPQPKRPPNESTETDCHCHVYGDYCYAKTNDCYQPYTQGPCEKGQHLALPKNEKRLECVDNPCEAFYEGSCYLYGDNGPCGPDGHLLPSVESYEPTCRCHMGAVKYVNSSKCYQLYTQGPCEKGQHLVVPENKTESECVRNPCEDNEVPFQGSCYSWDNGPCGKGGEFRLSSESYKPFCYCDFEYLPYVNTGTCFLPYTQGPCEKGNYLVSPENGTNLECVGNPCGDNEVPYNGSCYSLEDTNGPCNGNQVFRISLFLHKPVCEPVNSGESSVPLSALKVPLPACPEGHQRNGNETKCRRRY